MHNIIVGANSCFDALLHQETGLAVKIDRLFLIKIEPYFYPSFLGFYERQGNISVGKDIHGYIDKVFRLIDILYDFFSGIVVEGKVDISFGKDGN